MGSILDTLKSFNDDRLVLSEHPLKELELENKITYLTGLALVMNADENVQDSEKRYIATLIRTFELSDSLVDELEQNASTLDNDFIEAFRATLFEQGIVSAFFYDALMVCFQDGNYCDTEKAVIDQLCHLLNLRQKDITFIEHVVHAISSADLKEIESLEGERFWQWQYLLEYNHIEYKPEFLTVSCSRDLDSLIKTEPFSKKIKLAPGTYSLTSDDIEQFFQVKISGSGEEETTIYLEGRENVLRDEDEAYNTHSHELDISGMNIRSIKGCRIDSCHPELLILTMFDSEGKIFKGCEVDSDIEICDSFEHSQRQVQASMDAMDELTKKMESIHGLFS